MLYIVQEMGLEPTRYCYHRHLKPARLPIPPLLRTKYILAYFKVFVNWYLNIFLKLFGIKLFFEFFLLF